MVYVCMFGSVRWHVIMCTSLHVRETVDCRIMVGSHEHSHLVWRKKGITQCWWQLEACQKTLPICSSSVTRPLVLTGKYSVSQTTFVLISGSIYLIPPLSLTLFHFIVPSYASCAELSSYLTDKLKTEGQGFLLLPFSSFLALTLVTLIWRASSCQKPSLSLYSECPTILVITSNFWS